MIAMRFQALLQCPAQFCNCPRPRWSLPMTFSHRTWFAFVALLLLANSVGRADEQGLPRATPESQGISSRAVREYIEAADQKIIAMHSFMLVRHGKVIA